MNPPTIYTKNDLYRAYQLGKGDGTRKHFVELIKKMRWEREEHERIKKRLEKNKEMPEL